MGPVRIALAGALIVALGALALGGLGVHMILEQHRRITTWEPMRVTVLSSEVRSEITGAGDSRSRSHFPRVEYRYTWEGSEHTSTKVLPFIDNVSRERAHEIVGAFPAGATARGFVDPGNSDRAFLVPEHSFFPYVFTLMSLLVLLFVIDTPVWFARRLRLVSRGTRIKGLFGVAVLWAAGVAAALGHWHAVTEPPHATAVTVSAWGFGAITLIPLLSAVGHLMRGSAE